MSEDLSLYDLLDVSIGTPPRSTVDLAALHALLHAVLRQLDVLEGKTPWRGAPPGDRQPGAPVDVPEEPEEQAETPASERELQPGTEPQEPATSPASTAAASGAPEDGQGKLQSRIQSCEDGVSRAMTLIQELLHHRDRQRDEMEELRQQLKTLVNPGPVDWSAEFTRSPAAPGSPRITSQTPTLQEVVETPSVQSDSAPQSGAATPRSAGGGWGRSSEAEQVLRSVAALEDRFQQLEAQVSALEDGKVDQSQLDHLRELINKKGSRDAFCKLEDQLNQQRALTETLASRWEKEAGLEDDVQTAILQLQAECKELQETTCWLHRDARDKQSHIQELYKTTEELEVKKADKQMVESEIKADKSALDSKVSRLQFDSVTEQLNAMFHELLSKVTGQEQDWHQVMDRLSTEMERKLNRMELDSVKKQLEQRWKDIQRKLQAQGAPEHEDAAGFRKQLVDRFHCLSCDRPIVKHTPGPHVLTLPSSPAFPSRKSIRPVSVYALEQLRQHYRSVSEPADCGHPAVSRSCGGSHTNTSASQRRSGLQHMKHHGQAEGDALLQSEEVDIIGLDGHIYKGLLNVPAVRSAETKLPTISTKDGVCKTKDKARSSAPHKPTTSPEAGHSATCSRSASSCSGRDWPVVLGCMSPSSVAAAAQSSTEPPSAEPQLL